MTAKSRKKSQLDPKARSKKFLNRLLSAAIGISLLLSFKNIHTVVNLSNQGQLMPILGDSFASSKYLPIQFYERNYLAQQDFSQIDELAKQLKYSGASIVELANLLQQNITTESEKARIIYAWITQHITYDVPAFHDAVNNNNYPDVSPTKVLRDRTTICSGFSNLYYALASAMNLESVVVVGYGKGAAPEDVRFQDVNHAWNAVKIDRYWYLLDATWGAGTIRDNEFVADYQPYFFATSPGEFINSHYPLDRGWQLLSRTYTREEFDNLPSLTARFYDLKLRLVSHKNYQIYASDRINIELKTPQDVVALASLTKDNQEFTENAVLVNRQEDSLIVSVAPPEIGSYELTIFAKHKDEPNQYGEVLKYQVEATNLAAKLPQTYSPFHQYQASLIEPLSANLQPNWSTYFNLIVPEAVDVQVVNTNTQEWTALNGYGSYFAGSVNIKPGNISVVAKFPGEEEYWQLVDYQAQ